MSAEEFGDWIAFEAVFGPIVVHERIDAAGAAIASAVARIAGAEVSVAEFLPNWDVGSVDEEKVTERPEQTPEQMVAFMNTFRK